MNSYLINRLFGSVLLVLLLACSFVSAKWMVGDFYGERVALSLDHWNRNGISPDIDIVNRHLEFIAEARNLAPHSSRYMELEARLRLLRLYDMPFRDVMDETELMLNLHHSALENRPNWPFSWSNIVFLKGMFWEYDEEFGRALGSYMTYGPFEAAGLYRIISITARVRSWGEIPESAKQEIYLAVANLVELNRNMSRQVRNQLREEQLIDQFCKEVPFYSEQGRSRVCG